MTHPWLHRSTRWLPQRLRAWGKRVLYKDVPELRGSFKYFGERVFFPRGSHLFERVFMEGVFEEKLVQALCAHVRPATVYFDVGANIGLTSVPVLVSVKDCRVVSFEPSPNSLPFLRRTRDASRHRDRWTVVGKAVADQTGRESFSLTSKRDSAFEGLAPTLRRAESAKAVVDVTTLDEEWAALGRPRVSAIKSDTEGAEMRVLRGARECIAKCKPAVFIEWNADNLKAYGVGVPELLRLAEELQLVVHSLPDVARIDDTATLLAKCRETENFVLLPRP
jgi:FkbM family methyltransferase